MIRAGAYSHPELQKPIEEIKKKFNVYSAQIKLPKPISKMVFPDTFLSSEYYLIFPAIFKKAFKETDRKFVEQLCLSGYLYFKYLICMDSLHDKDVEQEHENAVSEEILILRSHTFHGEALKILGKHFGLNATFWEYWGNRNKEFLESILLDKNYDINLSFEAYQMLAVNKCSFLKTTVDAYYCRKPKYKKLHASLIKSFDALAIARCIQDDVEDFKKDILYKKNNLGHVLLNKWFKDQGKSMDEHSTSVLEKYLYISKTAEYMLSLSKQYYNKAIEVVKPFGPPLSAYIKHLEVLRNKCNLVKVNIEAYRITKFASKLKSDCFVSTNNINTAIANAKNYIIQMQNSDGSWFDIANKQGLSNVWATGFIAAHFNEKSEPFKKAIKFLAKNRQNGLWGYNSDWISDYDSTTCVLLALSKTNTDLTQDLNLWMKGQGENGGFSTYKKDNQELVNLLGFNNLNQIKGWTEEHVCVSAFAYCLLTQLELNKKNRARLSLLRTYLLKKRNRNGVWDPYWWTSYIYSTCLIIDGMLNEGNPELRYHVDKALNYMMSRQNRDGSFSCDTLNTKNVFYTAMVLNTISRDKSIYLKYKKNAMKMKNWLLSKQYDDGAFQGSNMLLIPKASIGRKKIIDQKFNINFAGGNNNITGDVTHLFTTSVTLKALQGLKTIDSVSNGK